MDGMVLILIDTRSLYKNRFQNEYNTLILKLILSAEKKFIIYLEMVIMYS